MALPRTFTGTNSSKKGNVTTKAPDSTMPHTKRTTHNVVKSGERALRIGNIPYRPMLIIRHCLRPNGPISLPQSRAPGIIPRNMALSKEPVCAVEREKSLAMEPLAKIMIDISQDSITNAINRIRQAIQCLRVTGISRNQSPVFRRPEASAVFSITVSVVFIFRFSPVARTVVRLWVSALQIIGDWRLSHLPV